MATFWLLRKRFKCSECSCVVSSHPVVLFFQFFKCLLLSIIVLLFCLLVFRSSIANESFIPSLAAHENEKHSSMMSFVVECRCLVSSIVMAVNVCVFTNKNRWTLVWYLAAFTDTGSRVWGSESQWQKHLLASLSCQNSQGAGNKVDDFQKAWILPVF